MTRIIVTGAAGRLGRTAVSELADRGHEVVGVDRAGADHGLDLTDAAATRELFSRLRPEAVIHLAAIAVPFSAPEPVILATNTALAHSVLAASVEAGAEAVLVASSPTVFGYGSPAGWTPERLPLDESVRPRPWNAYALSKLVAEQTAAMFAAQLGDRVRFGAFRPCYVIAPEEWAGAPTQQGHTVAERLADPALSAPALFNYVDARDVAGFLDLWVTAARTLPNAETFLVGADDALATAPLAELLPRFVPGTEALAAGLTGTAPAFSSAKARALLGWRPEHHWCDELAATANRTA